MTLKVFAPRGENVVCRDHCHSIEKKRKGFNPDRKKIDNPGVAQ
jgi:hypothetical protein